MIQNETAGEGDQYLRRPFKALPDGSSGICTYLTGGNPHLSIGFPQCDMNDDLAVAGLEGNDQPLD